VETTITVRLSEDLAEEARTAAEAQYRSLSNYVRLALIYYLDHHPADNRRYVNKPDIPA
jgi:hypothetical protein